MKSRSWSRKSVLACGIISLLARGAAGAQATPAPAEKAGPSEYTKMFGAQQGQPGEPAAYVPGAKPGNGPLIAIIVVIAVVLVLLVVTIVLSVRH